MRVSRSTDPGESSWSTDHSRGHPQSPDVLTCSPLKCKAGPEVKSDQVLLLNLLPLSFAHRFELFALEAWGFSGVSDKIQIPELPTGNQGIRVS